MKKISENQNDIEEKLSNEIKITDEEMRRNYYRALAMAFFGFILIISSLTILIFMAKVISVFYFFFFGASIRYRSRSNWIIRYIFT